MTQALECPICRRAVRVPATGAPSPFPFCSERCRQVDLLRWSKGRYAIVEPLGPEQIMDDAGSDTGGE